LALLHQVVSRHNLSNQPIEITDKAILMKKWLGKIINKAGYSVVKHSKDLFQEYRSEKEFMDLYNL